MLDPAARLVYLEELKPPEGFRLDRAIVTTYSLDLVSLLLAPLSMVMLDAHANSDGRLDPIGALEALRRTSDRFVVFCQKGRISVPKQQQLIFGCLEPAVVEALAPGGGAFHPKTWLLRFVSINEPQTIRYRFLCLSRNLTFDRSWDTALSLEGELLDATHTVERNRPISDFTRALPGMASEAIPVRAQEHVDLLSEEILRVRFAVPPGFQDEEEVDLSFQPMGLGNDDYPRFKTGKRLLIVSPFLSDGWLNRGVGGQFPRETTLVSRPDTLDSVSDSTYNALSDFGVKMFTVSDVAESGEDDEEPSPELSPTLDRLSGLHAKLYALEEGRKGVRLWTGSANATDAAFRGTNVEFVVGLRWPRKQSGIETLLGQAQDDEAQRRHGAATLADLLVPYERIIREEDPTLAIRRGLEADLDRARDAICQGSLELQVQETANCLWEMRLITKDELHWPDGVDGQVRPITLGPNESSDLAQLHPNHPCTFNAIQTHALTRFIAFGLKASRQGETVGTAFVLKMHATGIPDDRDSHILRAIVQNREGFLRILLLILMDEQIHEDALASGGSESTGSLAQFLESLGIPLFEELIRASNRHPDKIQRIARLLDELAADETVSDIIPVEFQELWRVFADYGVAPRTGDLDG